MIIIQLSGCFNDQEFLHVQGFTCKATLVVHHLCTVLFQCYIQLAGSEYLIVKVPVQKLLVVEYLPCFFDRITRVIVSAKMRTIRFM